MATLTKALLGEDLSGQIRDECSAHLDTLMALGRAKSEYYAQLINTGLLGAGLGTDKTFPISTIQSFIYDTRAYTSDNADNITNVVKDSIKGFVAGENVSAVGTIVSGFVNTLFGSSQGSESEIRRYCAILEGASMIRLDFAGWSRAVSSTSLKKKCDQVSAFVLYRSIVDMKKVLLNDFISVYQITAKAEHPDFDTAGIIKECQKLFSLFHPGDGSNGLLAASTPASLAASISSAEGGTFVPSKGHGSLNVFRNQLVAL